MLPSPERALSPIPSTVYSLPFTATVSGICNLVMLTSPGSLPVTQALRLPSSCFVSVYTRPFILAVSPASPAGISAPGVAGSI